MPAYVTTSESYTVLLTLNRHDSLPCCAPRDLKDDGKIEMFGFGRGMSKTFETYFFRTETRRNMTLSVGPIWWRQPFPVRYRCRRFPADPISSRSNGSALFPFAVETHCHRCNCFRISVAFVCIPRCHRHHHGTYCYRQWDVCASFGNFVSIAAIEWSEFWELCCQLLWMSQVTGLNAATCSVFPICGEIVTKKEF